MISKKYKLGTKEFKKTIDRGCGYNSEFFYLKTLKNSEGILIAGVGVSKKLARKAVKRNYYKRILWHILKDVLGSNFNSLGYNIVLIAQEGVDKNKFEYLKKDAQSLFEKAKLI